MIRANPELLDDTLLEGHLNLTKELFNHVPAQVKFQYGAHPDHPEAGLIKVYILFIYGDILQRKFYQSSVKSYKILNPRLKMKIRPVRLSY